MTMSKENKIIYIYKGIKIGWIMRTMIMVIVKKRKRQEKKVMLEALLG